MDKTFGKLCRRILTFLAGKPSLLVVGGPTGCGKLTAAQHCVAHVGRGLVEIVNQAAAATKVVAEIKRSGNMLVATGETNASVIVVSGADGIQTCLSDLLECGRHCKKHVIIIVNGPLAFASAEATERYRCSWHKPWSSDALRDAIDSVPGADLLTVQEKGVMIRSSTDLRQLKLATETLINCKRLGCDESELLHALCDSPVHQYYNTLEIVQGKRLPTEHHNIGWISGSYLSGMASDSLEAVADFANNLTVADTLSDDCEFSDSYSALVLQSAMPLVSHRDGLQIEKIKLDMPRPNKRARYNFTLQEDA